MAIKNTRANKCKRSARRPARKHEAAKRIPFGGVIVSRHDVLRHRYLAKRGLAHSKNVAAVLLPKNSRAMSPLEAMRELARFVTWAMRQARPRAAKAA